MKKLKATQLQPGMLLARTVLNDNMIVILAENTMLSKAHITRLSFLGIEEVYVKDEYDLNPQFTLVHTLINRSNAFVKEYEEVLTFAEDIFITITNSKELPLEKTTKLQKSISPLVKQSGVIDYLYELKHMDNSTYNHSLRVSILAGVLAKWLLYDDDKIRDVSLAGFLHDIGKTQLDKKISNKNIENLSSDEYEIYIQHTVNGYHLLANNPAISDYVKTAVLQHHEKIDGSGVPFNSIGNEIGEYAKMIAIVDLYDHMTTEREGFVKQTPFSAIDKITEDMFTTLDPTYCVPFLINVKQSFIGSKVLLSDKTRGKIIQYPKDYASKPLIETDKHAIIDLNHEKSLRIIEYNPD